MKARGGYIQAELGLVGRKISSNASVETVIGVAGEAARPLVLEMRRGLCHR